MSQVGRGEACESVSPRSPVDCLVVARFEPPPSGRAVRGDGRPSGKFGLRSAMSTGARIVIPGKPAQRSRAAFAFRSIGIALGLGKLSRFGKTTAARHRRDAAFESASRPGKPGGVFPVRFDRYPAGPAPYLGGAAGAMRTLLAAIFPVRSIPNS
jgi:hypothetical protein